MVSKSVVTIRLHDLPPLNALSDLYLPLKFLERLEDRGHLMIVPSQLGSNGAWSGAWRLGRFDSCAAPYVDDLQDFPYEEPRRSAALRWISSAAERLQVDEDQRRREVGV